jgi:hypothetical protein
MPVTQGRSDMEEVRVRGELRVRETCGAPQEQRTRDESSAATMLRRLLLNRQPDA